MEEKDTLFTKIIKGEIPCHKIYEDKLTFAFLDLYPKQPGHVLVVPKESVEFIWDLPVQTYEALMNSARKVGSHIRQAMGAKYVGMMVEGLGVSHAHVHVFPFNSSDEYYVRRDSSGEPDHKALAEVAEKLRMKDES